MLLEMGIRNFALIEQMHVSFEKGITVITGETGAGKSILIDALSILLGERASSEFIRHGKDCFIITAHFDITGQEELMTLLEEKNILVEDAHLFLSRSFSKTGKTQILANDQPIPLKVLREIGPYLADIHGQYSNQALLDKNVHHEFLDTFSDVGMEAFQAYKDAYQTWNKARKALEALEQSAAERERELDMLRYQIDEIVSAQLKPGEDKQISEELQRFDNYERLFTTTQGAYASLYEGRHPMLDLVNQVRTEMGAIVRYDESLQEVHELFSSVYFQLEEAGHTLSNYIDNISYDEERYDYCRQRDSILYTLKKKYGSSIEEVISFGEKAQERLESLEQADTKRGDLAKQVAEYESIALEALSHLKKIRELQNEQMVADLQDNLADLGLPKARLCFVIEGTETLTPLGAENIELMFAPNAGEGFRPLAKIASGGELSRIALALANVVHKGTHRLVVFDEIDVGISGDIALRVAEKIKNLSMVEQVFCITHMPQTVAIADQHFHLSKKEVEGRTYSTMTLLDSESHCYHMAAMISGSQVTEAALDMARELQAHFQ